MLESKAAPAVATNNRTRDYADQIRSHIMRFYGRGREDNFGGSDYPVKLRQFFEENRPCRAEDARHATDAR